MMYAVFVLDCRARGLFDSGDLDLVTGVTFLVTGVTFLVTLLESESLDRFLVKRREPPAEAEATWHIVKAIPGPDEVVLRSLMC